MSLRKPPRRTRALLAANRRNARKSTGPRTELGKSHSAVNAVRHYRRTQFASCLPIENREIRAFEDFLFKLREAIIPADNAAGTEAVLLKAAEVWRVKRSFERWIETRTEEDWLMLAAGAVSRPRSWRLKLRRPGLSEPDWMVTASVCLRWGREPTRGLGHSGAHSGGGSQRSAIEDNERPDRPRMHTLVSVHSTGPRHVARASNPCCSRPELPCHELGQLTEPESERTNPESTTIQSGSENMSVRGDCNPSYVEAYALAERIIGWVPWGRRTKPECDREHATSENMSAGGELAGRNRDCSDGTTILGRIVHTMKAALIPRKEHSQLPPFQTKPECVRKDGACKNISKAPAWLGVATSSLLKLGSHLGLWRLGWNR